MSSIISKTQYLQVGDRTWAYVTERAVSESGATLSETTYALPAPGWVHEVDGVHIGSLPC